MHIFRFLSSFPAVRFYALVVILGGLAFGGNSGNRTFEQLPAQIQKSISLNFPYAKIIDIKKTDTRDGYLYTIDLVAKKDTLELFLSETSMILSLKKE
jgi:hypothetical protein